MPLFEYRALDARLKPVRGNIESGDLRTAGKMLRDRGLTLTALAEQSPTEPAGNTKPQGNALDFLSGFTWVKKADVISVLKRFAALTEAGVSVVAALEIVAGQMKKKKLSRILTAVKESVEEGMPLSNAMEKHPGAFSKMVTNLIQAGESTGLLDNSIRQAADYMQQRAALKKQLIAGFIYPGVVLVVTITVVVFLVVVVIPQVVPLLEMNGGELPWNTLLLIHMTEYIQKHYVPILTALGSIITAVLVTRQTESGRYFLDKHKFKLPLFGLIFQYSVVVQFSRTMSLMLESGISIIDSLKSTGNTIANRALKKTVDEMAAKVLAGEPLSEPIGQAKNIFPPMVESMVKVGEETGGIDAALLSVAQIFEEMLTEKVRALNALMEPVLILLMAGMVGFVAWALIAGMLAGYGA
jgi:type IV pilus assembly protein PilC